MVGNSSVQSPAPNNITKQNMPTTNNNLSVKLEPPSNPVNSSHQPSPPANVVPSINSIINHSVLPTDLPSIDLPLQSYSNTKSIGTENEVMNAIDSLHQHNRSTSSDQINNTVNHMGVSASNFESAIPSSESQAPYVSNESILQGPGVGPGPTFAKDSPVSSNSSWLKTTATDFLQAADDDWFHLRDIQVGQLMFGNSGNAKICQSSNRDYGWLVDEVKDDYGILDNLEYVGEDNYHYHDFEH
ncbi:unnamed protein product [Ambrosiozyma monospora]|uniref:Unnamed protein product n=1 Tax=Ambrosiozyma monospora TaxID=43982 RepID=A0ACB5UB55_AMBMO|nr:unnamed protein product [Ambrosiozyma monospora]